MEDFHGNSEKTVRQECYAHILLINIARMFENEANVNLPTSENKNSNQEDSYWQSFFGVVRKFKINFKNCLLVTVRSSLN
ncbi:MAG: hypothetical protein EP298_03550 [Gammaproteobacteria bacterium]|nr:MAG: hypothetical protein EP298_03550 [Gammaproteobacteria bacterium]